jgi:hypothetical protein
MVDDRIMSSAYASSMRVEPSPLVLTAPEVADVVSQLEREPCSVRQVRYLLSALRRTDPEPQRGHARLYDLDDVALMRLAVRLQTQGISAWVTRVVLAYGADEIRAAWSLGAPVALVVRGVTGFLEPVKPEPHTPAASARVPLRAVWSGVKPAMRSPRRTRPLWRGRPVPVSVAMSERSA